VAGQLPAVQRELDPVARRTRSVGPRKPRRDEPSAPVAAEVWVSATVRPLISTLPFSATSVVLSRPPRLLTTGGSVNAVAGVNGAGGMTLTAGGACGPCALGTRVVQRQDKPDAEG
jgi:hypothetical protein